MFARGCKALWKGVLVQCRVCISWAGCHTLFFSPAPSTGEPASSDCLAWASVLTSEWGSRKSLCKGGLAIRFFQDDCLQAWLQSLEMLQRSALSGQRPGTARCCRGSCRRAGPDPLGGGVCVTALNLGRGPAMDLMCPEEFKSKRREATCIPRLIPGLERSQVSLEEQGFLLSLPSLWLSPRRRQALGNEGGEQAGSAHSLLSKGLKCSI